MLIDFKVKNFLSFEEQESLSLVAGKGRNFDNRLYKDKKNKILKFSALFGANGSGKSNFVKAIYFSREYIKRGDNRATIQKYYKINPAAKEQPTSFEYKIKVGEKIYTYGFELLLIRNQIIKEWLICNNSRSDELIFSHDRGNKNFILGNHFKNSELRNRLFLYADGLDSNNNALFLNNINSYNNLYTDYNETKILKDVYNWFIHKLKVKFPDSVVSDYAYFMSESNMDEILKFFKDFDLSISNYKFIKCSQEEIALKLPKEIFNDFIGNVEKALLEDDDIEHNRVMFGLADDFYIAKMENGQMCFDTIQFYHENTDVPFHMHEESDGTKKIFKLLEILFQQENDVVYIVDEIDRCLHPFLTYNFIHAFLKNAKTKNCQLIVTTHESLILDFKLLRKDEVRLVTKYNGKSIIDSLADSPIRADKVLIKNYLFGQKGIPNIKDNAYKI